MRPSHHSELAAVATQLVTALDAYERDLDALIQRRWDPALYERVGAEFDEMRHFASALPRLMVSWTELLISRTELSHALWLMKSPTRLNGRVLGLHARHKTIISEVRRKSYEYLFGSGR